MSEEQIKQGETTMDEEELLKSLDTLEELVKSQADKQAKGEASEAGVGEAEVEIISKGDLDDDAKDEPDDRGGEGDQENQEDQGEPEEKSFAEQAAESSENIRKAIEVSAFLGDLVEEVGKAIEGLKSNMRARLDKIEKSLAETGNVNLITETISKSLRSLLEMAKANSSEMEDLKKSIGEISLQPIRGKKSMTVLEKSMIGGRDDGEKTLSKGEILKALTDMVITGQPGVMASDIVSFESGSPLRPDVLERVRARIKG